MSDPRLVIVLAPSSSSAPQQRDCWRAGDVLRGVLRLELPEVRTLRGARMELSWKTDGRGNATGATVDQANIGSAELFGGPRIEVPFDLHIPDAGPISHDGHLVCIRWLVKATIDVRWNVDPTVSYPIVVLPKLAASSRALAKSATLGST